MEETILKIDEDVEGLLIVSIDDEVAWEVSDKFKSILIEELKDHLGGDFSDEFDPLINNAIDKITACIKSSDLDYKGSHLYRVK